MKRVLFISYFYPPYRSVGATRVSKMTRYLADVGWEAHVLTVDAADLPAGAPIEVPEQRIYRIPCSFDVMALPRMLVGRGAVTARGSETTDSWKSASLWRLGQAYRNVVCFPDAQVGWAAPAARAAIRLIGEVRPHVLVSSSLPNASHLAAWRAAAATGIPWVAELRDLWTDNHNFRRIPPLRYLERRLEHKVLSRADALVTPSGVWSDALARRFSRPTYVVPNGFDPLDYPDGCPPAGRMELVYTGMFYNGKQNPDPLFGAVASLAQSGAIRPEAFRLRFVGQYLAPLAARAEAAGIGPFVAVEPPVPYRDALGLQKSATALVFFDWADGREKGWYSAKIYEYLGAGRPVISIGPQGSVVADLLRRTGAGQTASTRDEARAILAGWLDEQSSTGGVTCRSDAESLRPYWRQTAAATLGRILDAHARF
ncbi:MAG: glycosyltransferase [Vicinamibacterales bacterium]